MATANGTGEEAAYSEFLQHLSKAPPKVYDEPNIDESDDILPDNLQTTTNIFSTTHNTTKPPPPTDPYQNTTPVSFFSLFRHGTTTDLLIISLGMLFQSCVGASFAAMNLVFGQLIDDLASPSGSVLDTTSSMIKLMGVLAVVFAILAFVGMSFIPYGAARITNRVREEYVKSVLRQDMAFFDEAKPGGIVASLSGYTLDFEEGISIKLGEGIQSSWCV
jgi:ABC-type bacteriocin/lantibiotic exporter with double-glycine peptidase domain